MSPKLYSLLAVCLSFSTLPSLATNHGSPPPSPQKPICSESGGPTNGSISWRVEVGLARYTQQNEFMTYANMANEPDGSLPTFSELHERGFSQDPLQESQVAIEFTQSQIGASTFHPSCLSVYVEAAYELIKKPEAGDSREYIHQILTSDRFTLIDVLPAPESGWRLRIWKRDAAPLNKSGAFYVTSGFEALPPLKDVVFKRPAGSSDYNTLIYIQKESTGLAGTRIITNETVQTSSTVTSKLFAGEGTQGPLLSKEVLDYSERGTQDLPDPRLAFDWFPRPFIGARVWDYTIKRKVYTASVNEAGTIGGLVLTRSTREDYDDYSVFEYEKPTSGPVLVGPIIYHGGAPGMKRLVSLTEGYDVPGQSPQITSYTYINNPQNPAAHGRLLSSIKPDGSWTYQETTASSGNPYPITTEYSGWKDLTLDQRANARKTVTMVRANESIAETYVAGQLVSKLKNTVTTQGSLRLCTSEEWDGNVWHITSTAYYLDNAPPPNTGRIKWIENSDGTAATYSYDTVHGNLVATARTGAGSRSGVTTGIETITTYGLGNFPIAQVTKDITSGLSTEQWDTDLAYYGGFDAIGRPIKRIYNADVNDYDINQYACCGLEYSRDRMGATTSYSRDGLKRVYKVETKASEAAASSSVATFTTVSGLTTTRTRRFGSSDALFLGSTTRSLDGLTTVETGPFRKSTLGEENPVRPVTNSVISHSATGDTVTTTFADGSDSITASYLDGQAKSVTGSAVPDMSYDYATKDEDQTPLGAGMVLRATTMASGVGTSTFTDLLGRTVMTRSAATGGTTHSYYPLTAPAGSRGKLQSVTDGDGVTITYGYNAEGERTSTSRTIPLAGDTTATQVTTTERDVVSDATLHGASLGISFRTTQAVASTGIAAVTTSESFASIDGLVSGASSFGSQTLNIATRPDASGIATRTTIRPDGTQSVQTTTHGLVTTVQEKSTAGSVITGTSYTYDSFQRPETLTDLRTGPVTYSNFTEAGQPLTVTTNGNTDVTTTENDIMGRTVKTTLPDTTVKHTAYHPTGQVKVIWGSQTYPTWNIYDEQGRMTQLHTWKTAPALDPAAIHLPTSVTPPAGSDVTTWIYGPATGRLDRKQYADGNGTDYTYTDAGRLETRGWARGITTTYGYEYGLMTSTNYSDTTPDVTITYEPLGRQETVTQANLSQIAYTYDPANLALDTETIQYDLDHDGTADFTRVLDRSRDTLQRDNGWQLKDGSTIENQAAYGYHATTGRLSQISNPQISNLQFTYGYEPGSSLVGTITGPAHTVTNTWEPTRDALDLKKNEVGSTEVSGYNYSVNKIGQRDDVTTTFDLGGAIPANPGLTNWGYDPLGQVTGADHSVNNTLDRAYQYDFIGNRTEARNEVTAVTGTPNYTANNLNQYSVAAGVTLPVTPAPAPHDLDGNLRFDGGVNKDNEPREYVWDAENRLIAVRRVSDDATLVSYTYDSQSRRISRSVSVSPTSTTLFLYDSFNCIAEYSFQNSTSAIQNSYLWGLDLSGTQQGAGGIGGLLAVRQGSVVHYPTFDGNGNVSEYIGSAGQVAAHFEYDPFGNTVVNTDGSDQFSYRFSTKPLDFVTGLYYYLYRYYNPLMGRWPSRDPIEEEGGVNLYGFVGNDGVGRFDYLGLSDCDDCDGKSKGAKTQSVSEPYPTNSDGATEQQYQSEAVIRLGGAVGLGAGLGHAGGTLMAPLPSSGSGAYAGITSAGAALLGTIADNAGGVPNYAPIASGLGSAISGYSEFLQSSGFMSVDVDCKECTCCGGWFSGKKSWRIIEEKKYISPRGRKNWTRNQLNQLKNEAKKLCEK
jgi:RHS repeat-associated protein